MAGNTTLGSEGGNDGTLHLKCGSVGGTPTIKFFPHSVDAPDKSDYASIYYNSSVNTDNQSSSGNWRSSDLIIKCADNGAVDNAQYEDRIRFQVGNDDDVMVIRGLNESGGSQGSEDRAGVEIANHLT